MLLIGMDDAQLSLRVDVVDTTPPDAGTLGAHDVDMDLPLSLQQLLRNEWLHQNMSQMLNISVDNLTSLLIHAQNTMVPQNQMPPRIHMPFLVVLTTCYAIIFVAGVLGNLITCFVISKCKFMHTATNFYLFNLAVSDLILLLSGMPQDLYNLWRPNSYPSTDALCIIESVLSETAANATVLTITAFTVERYIAICHPFRQHTMSKLSRAIKFIFAIWIMAFLLALPQAMQFSVVAQDNGTSCTMQNDFFAHVFAVSGFIFFGGPMTAICVLYVLIGVKLKRSRLLQAVPRRAYDINRGISAQGRVIRMLVAVAVAFFLCWAPFHAQRLTAVYGSSAGINSKVFNNIFDVLDYSAGVLYFLSTCINPLLYNIMSHKFREAFKVTLSRHFGLGGRYQTQNRNYSAMIRQNGSVRLHTTDSIRTTVTTTTMHSATGGGGGGQSCRSSHRNRCVSIGSKGTLLPSLSRPDIYSTAATSEMGLANGSDVQRILRHQVSQLSSMGDANSLLEDEAGDTSDQPPAMAKPTGVAEGNGMALLHDRMGASDMGLLPAENMTDDRHPDGRPAAQHKPPTEQEKAVVFERQLSGTPAAPIQSGSQPGGMPPTEATVTAPTSRAVESFGDKFARQMQRRPSAGKWKCGRNGDNIVSTSFSADPPPRAVLVAKLAKQPSNEASTAKVATVSITQNGASPSEL